MRNFWKIILIIKYRNRRINEIRSIKYNPTPVWLRKRTEAFIKERWTYAPPTFLPALTDWLYVDDRWTQNVAQPADGHPFEVDVPILDVPRACNQAIGPIAKENSTP